ncbi:MAG: hypothetical protein QOF78_4046 [Phycisphaerales bacterium]|nr:hypothetical protein [Phycisphaerales bacterium]
MLHNSLFRRELLQSMNRHPLIAARRDVHRNVSPRPVAKVAADQVIFRGAWAVRAARKSAAETAVAADAADFLKRMGVDVRDDAKNEILFEIGSAERGFRVVASETRLDVHAADAGALWAGWVSVENQMRTSGGPIVARGEFSAEPAWNIQIAPPTWGSNYAVPDLSPEYVTDDTFRSLAHAGADGMFIYGDFLVYAAGTRFEELNYPEAEKNLATLRQASERAAAYGVKLYYVAVSPKLAADHSLFKRRPSVRGARLFHGPDHPGTALHCLCSSDAEALGFHADVFGRMFKEVPQLGGVILIIGGESYYHCFMRAGGAALAHTNCAKCEGKVPEDVIANLLKTTADAVHAAKPQAEVMAWPYSAHGFWSKEPNQFDLIDRLPEGVALLSEIDKEQKVTRGGIEKYIWDYSVDYDGHSDRIVAQSLRCAQRDRKLFIKTETAHGIELLHLPYVPAIGRSATQWESVRALRPRGVLQRWGFIGMFDSAAERIGWQARWNPSFTPSAATLAVARQLCAGDVATATQIVAAWKHFDESVHHIPVLTTGAYYCGPAFLGPCHPLPVWDPKGAIPDAFKGNLYYLLENEPSLNDSRTRQKDDLTLTATHQLGGAPPVPVEAEFSLARDAAAKGHAILASIKTDALPDGVRAEIAEHQAIGELLYRTYRATVNTIRFVRLIEEAKGDREKIRPVLVEIAKDELENTQAAEKMYEATPWLNHNLRLDVGMPDSLSMVREKRRLLEAYLAAGKS